MEPTLPLAERGVRVLERGLRSVELAMPATVRGLLVVGARAWAVE